MCKGFVLPSNCIDDRGLPAFCVFHGTKSVNNGVMCKGFWLLLSHCIDDLGCTAFCVFHVRARRTTRSSNTKACIPAGKHLQVIPLCCHEAVWLCSLCVAACRCTRCRWGTNQTTRVSAQKLSRLMRNKQKRWRARWRFCKKQVQARLPLRSRYRMLARLDGPQPMLE